MRPFLYITGKSLRNLIKDLVRKPIVLIGYLLLAGFLIKAYFTIGSKWNYGSIGMDGDYVRAILMGLSIIIFFFNILSILKGRSFFKTPDINMIFTAPLEGSQVLMYGYARQLVKSLGVAFLFAFFYPIVKYTFGLLNGFGWMLLISYLLFINISYFIGVILYYNVSNKPDRIFLIKGIVYGVLAVFFIPVIIKACLTGNLLEGMTWLGKEYLKYLPIVGWVSQLFMMAHTGLKRGAYLYMFLQALIILAMLLYIYYRNTEFYESLIKGIEDSGSIRKIIMEGKIHTLGITRRAKKEKKESEEKVKKTRRIYDGFTLWGSPAILQRQILSKKKLVGMGIVRMSTIILIFAAIMAALLLEGSPMTIMMGIFIVAVLLFIISLKFSPWAEDVSLHYIYFIPEHPLKKMLIITLVDLVKLIVEGILVFFITGLILGLALVDIISFAIAYISLGAVLIYFDLAVRRLFGKTHSMILRIYSYIFLLGLIISGAAVPAAISFVVTGSYSLSLFISAVVNLFLIIIFLLMGTELFKYPELP